MQQHLIGHTSKIKCNQVIYCTSISRIRVTLPPIVLFSYFFQKFLLYSKIAYIEYVLTISNFRLQNRMLLHI